MSQPDPIQSIRRFNRFYTQRIGALSDGYLGGEHNLSELRILHEVHATPGVTARTLAERLGMDEGFLSRTVTSLVKKGALERTQSPSDKRAFALTLTPEAEARQPALQQAANSAVENMLTDITPANRHALITAMGRIEAILNGAPPSPIVFRQLQPGDAGWITHRHGGAIATEFGWNLEFEALCAQIMADFIKSYRPADERSWIVERDGEILGSLFLIRENETTARLRLLYVEPSARGLGLATKLLEKSIEFARSKGYGKVILFTTDSNIGARRIYDKLNMKLVKEEPFNFAGKQQKGETWAIDLT